MLQECKQRNSSVEQLSYNVVLTRGYLQIMPRSTEASGDVSVNALGGAGTFFVKRQEQLKYLEERTPGRVLSDVGFPW
jgi:sulfate adenylyltransferase (ADP) / ATP adenylyltransferase